MRRSCASLQSTIWSAARPIFPLRVAIDLEHPALGAIKSTTISATSSDSNSGGDGCGGGCFSCCSSCCFRCCWCIPGGLTSAATVTVTRVRSTARHHASRCKAPISRGQRLNSLIGASRSSTDCSPARAQLREAISRSGVRPQRFGREIHLPAPAYSRLDTTSALAARCSGVFKSPSSPATSAAEASNTRTTPTSPCADATCSGVCNLDDKPPSLISVYAAASAATSDQLRSRSAAERSAGVAFRSSPGSTSRPPLY